jgi:hypothetical protein
MLAAKYDKDGTHFRHVHKISKNDSFVLSIRMEQLGSHWTDFDET